MRLQIAGAAVLQCEIVPRWNPRQIFEVSVDESFDPSSIRAIVAALRGYEQRCEAILVLLGDRQGLVPVERDEIRRLYEALKTDLKTAERYGTLSGRRQARSPAEERFFEPAVRKSFLHLCPATNSDPIASHWFGAVSDAKTELSSWLLNLASLPGFAEQSDRTRP